MQLKTSEFQGLFNDGLNGLAGEILLGPDTCLLWSRLTLLLLPCWPQCVFLLLRSVQRRALKV